MAITPLWMAGMDTASLLELTSTVGGVSASTTHAKTGTYSLKIPKFSTNVYGIVSLSGGLSQGRIGFHIRPQVGNINGYFPNYLALFNGSSQVISVYGAYNSATVGIWSNGVGHGTTTFTAGAWQHWAIDYKIHASTGWLYFYIDGVLAISHSGSTGSSSPDSVRFGTSGTNNAYADDLYFDDMYIDSTVGEASAAVAPDKRFLLGVPTADVTSQWTPSTGSDHYALVDEIPPSGSDYVQASAADLVDTFTHTFPSLPAGFGPNAVWAVATAFKSDAGTPSTLKMHQSDGTNTEDSAAINLSTSAAMQRARFAAQPDANVWTEAALSAIRLGVKSAGSY